MILRRWFRPVGAFVVALSVLLLSGEAAHAGKEPFDPAGVILSGTEKHPDAGKIPVGLHLGAGGEAAGDILDLEGAAFGFAGTWTFEDGILTVDLEPEGELGSPVSVELVMKSSGKGKGTLTRGEGPTSSLKVKVSFPAKKQKGYAAVIPRLRHTRLEGDGTVRATVVLRSLAKAKKKPKPLVLSIRSISLAGVPGRTSTVEVLPGETVRLDGGVLPSLLPGFEAETAQYVITSKKKKGFGPADFQVLAWEEALRDLDPTTSGTAVPVHWVTPLKKKDLALRDRAPMVAPWFLDEQAGAGVRRGADLVLRDLSPFTGDPDLGSVFVRVFAVDGEPIGSGTVDVPRGVATVVDPRDLLDEPGDFTDLEGYLVIGADANTDLDRGRLAALVDAPILDDGDVIASLVHPVMPQPAAGTTATVAAPFTLSPDDESASTTLRVLNLSASTVNVPVRVLAPDATVLHNTSVNVPAGEMRRVDADAVGMNLSLLDDFEGRGQVLLGPDGGLDVEDLAFHGEVVREGSPDSWLAGLPVRSGDAAGDDGETLALLDAIETLGSDPGDVDTILSLRNGGAAAVTVTVRALESSGRATGSIGFVEHTLQAGETLDLLVEEVLQQVGAPLDPNPDEFRGVVEVEIPAGAGPVDGVGVLVRYSGQATGGAVLPLQRR